MHVQAYLSLSDDEEGLEDQGCAMEAAYLQVIKLQTCNPVASDSYSMARAACDLGLQC